MARRKQTITEQIKVLEFIQTTRAAALALITLAATARFAANAAAEFAEAWKTATSGGKR